VRRNQFIFVSVGVTQQATCLTRCDRRQRALPTKFPASTVVGAISSRLWRTHATNHCEDAVSSARRRLRHAGVVMCSYFIEQEWHSRADSLPRSCPVHVARVTVEALVAASPKTTPLTRCDNKIVTHLPASPASVDLGIWVSWLLAADH